MDDVNNPGTVDPSDQAYAPVPAQDSAPPATTAALTLDADGPRQGSGVVSNNDNPGAVSVEDAAPVNVGNIVTVKATDSSPVRGAVVDVDQNTVPDQVFGRGLPIDVKV